MLTIPLGTTFQFRADAGSESLQVGAATIPPWPVGSLDEARFEAGPWIASIGDQAGLIVPSQARSTVCGSTADGMAAGVSVQDW